MYALIKAAQSCSMPMQVFVTITPPPVPATSQAAPEPHQPEAGDYHGLSSPLSALELCARSG
jgi:hypothetical protein